MNSIFHCFIYFCYLSTCSSFKTNLKYTKYKLNLVNNDYSEDVNILHNYKSYLFKDNYNNIIDELFNKKIDRLFIDTHYNQIMAVDNINSDDMIYNHYHLSNINPIVVPNLVSKTSELNIPLYFIDFTNPSIHNLQNFRK